MPSKSNRANPTEGLPFEDIEKLLGPLFDLATCEYTSLSNFRCNYKSLIAKLYETGSPLILNVHKHRLLLCDPKTFFDLENRRRWVLAGCKTVEDLIRVGKVSLPDSRIQQLDFLKTELAMERKHLTEANLSREVAKKKIAALQTEVEALTKVLTTAATGAGSGR